MRCSFIAYKLEICAFCAILLSVKKDIPRSTRTHDLLPECTAYDLLVKPDVRKMLKI